MINLEDIYHIFAYCSTLVVLLIVSAHLISKFFKKEPLEINKNSLVVIVGACMGIGKEMALELSRLYKCRLIIIDRRRDLFEAVSLQLAQLGAKCQFLYCDLGSKQSLNETIYFLLERNQPIDLFIYNAGIAINRRSWQVTDEEHEVVMMVNYFAPTIMIRKLQRLLKHVCVVASMAAIISGGCHVSTYSASKHAIYSYLCSLRQQYKRYNKKITVSIGCPYLVTTTLFQGFKTKIDFLVRHLSPEYSGKRLLKEFIERKQVCFMYLYEAILFRIIDLMPSGFIDWCAIKLDNSDFKSVNQGKESIKLDKDKSE